MFAMTGPLITLDTACVSAVANPQTSGDQAEVDALTELIDLARVGTVRLQVTTSYERDFERWNDESGRQERLQWLADAPPIGQAPGVFRFDVSALDGPDQQAGEKEIDLDARLRQILGPERARRHDLPSHEDDPGAAARVMSDIDHLLAHYKSGAAWFVTTDVRTILKRSAQLAEVGINVTLPSQALQRICG
jgi:hypothetical protein